MLLKKNSDICPPSQPYHEKSTLLVSLNNEEYIYLFI